MPAVLLPPLLSPPSTQRAKKAEVQPDPIHQPPQQPTHPIRLRRTTPFILRIEGGHSLVPTSPRGIAGDPSPAHANTKVLLSPRLVRSTHGQKGKPTTSIPPLGDLDVHHRHALGEPVGDVRPSHHPRWQAPDFNGSAQQTGIPPAPHRTHDGLRDPLRHRLAEYPCHADQSGLHP